MIIKEKTTAQLEKELRLVKITFGLLIGILLVLFSGCMYGLSKLNNNSFYTSLIIVPIALSAILPLNFIIIKKIKTELETRKNSLKL